MEVPSLAWMVRDGSEMFGSGGLYQEWYGEYHEEDLCTSENKPLALLAERIRIGSGSIKIGHRELKITTLELTFISFQQVG